VRLLVTRPEPDASDLAARLRALGHTVLIQPMMRIEFADEPAVLPEPAAIVVTSRNAARALGGWRRAVAWRALPVFAVGEATARMAGTVGFSDVRIGSGDVAALAAMVRATGVAGPILYPAARDRSADLKRLLAPLTVVTVDAYRGVAASRLDSELTEAIAAGTIDGALFFSRRTAAIFADLVAVAGVAAGLRRTTLFVLSAAVAEPLGVLNAGAVAVAERPEEKALLALVPPAV